MRRVVALRAVTGRDDPAPRLGRHPAGASPRSRILTALALTALLVVSIIYCPPRITTVIFALILLIGAWEWSAFLRTGFVGRVL